MRRRKYPILIGALVVSIGAIILPQYMMSKTINHSFGKTVKVEKIADEGKVAVLNKDEAYKLTSLMMQGKLTARKEFIKKVPYDEFYKKFPEFDNIYSATRLRFEHEKIYPMVNRPEQFVYNRSYNYSGGSPYKEIFLKDPIVSLYQYKENVFYNFETSIWEVKWIDERNTITYSIQIDEDLRAYQTEVKINEPGKGTELNKIHLTVEDFYQYLKTMSVGIDVMDVKKLSSEKQRFVIGTNRKEQYYVDVTSTKTLFRMEMKAVAE